ncbi:MAG: tetratricopeptide repeat protein [Candidatus Eisenbacteria bacterium]|nr:tetratricopeptide repeat protein [Candidatus Eisenbacteria bacterium]
MSNGARTRILRAAETVEAMPITLGRWLLILGAIIVLRHFLEQLSGQQKTLYFLSYFLHYPLAYVAPLIALSMVLSAFSRERVERVTKLMLFAWLLTLLPPLIDLLLARTTESPELIGYLIPRSGTLTGAFLNLLNPGYQQFQGATAGIRIEAGLGCLLGAFYVHLKTRSIARSVCAFVAIYVTMFFFFTLPVIVLALSRLLGGDVHNVYQLFFARASIHRAFANATPFALSDMSNALVDLLVIAPLLIIWYRMYDSARFGVLRRLFDWPTVAFHVLSTLAGLVLGAVLLMGSRGIPAIVHPFDAISIVGILASSLFVAVTASALRELNEPGGGAADEDRDALCTLGVFSFSVATLLALSVSYVALTYVLSTLAVYYFYYARPLRLERFTPLAGLAIGGVALFSVTLGFAAYAGGSASLWLPGAIVAACLMIPLLAFLARDVWSSSAKHGRWNLVTMLGPGKARLAAAAGVLLAAVLPSVLLRDGALLIPGAVAGVAGAVTVVRLRSDRIPSALTILGAAALLAGFWMGAAEAPTLASSLAETDFSRAARRSGEFELFDREGATEEQRLLADGIDRFRRGDYEGAIDAFRQVTETDPENTQAFVSVGSAYMRMNRLSEAGRAFRRAISLEPDNAAAHVGLAQVQKLAGDPDAALEELEVALEADPENADAHYTKAIIYGELGDLEQEMEALLQAVSADPRNSLAQSRLADIYLANEMFPEAIAALKAALTGRTTVDHLHTRMADAYYSLGDLESAESELRKEIALRPRLASPHANLARLLGDAGRLDEARHEYETAISLTEDERLRGFLEGELSALGR